MRHRYYPAVLLISGHTATASHDVDKVKACRGQDINFNPTCPSVGPLSRINITKKSCVNVRLYLIGELPKLCVKILPDSWLVCGPFRCHPEWRHEWQHGGLCPCRRSFGCVLLLDQIFRKQCTVRQYTTLIYLINLLGKLVLGLWLDSELHYFCIFTENKKNEHLIFCECHGR